MHLTLDDALLRGLDLNLDPEVDPSRAPHVQIKGAEGVEGELNTGVDGVLIPRARVRQLVFESLRLMFGTVVLEATANTELGGVNADYRQPASGDLRLELQAQELRSPQLTVKVSTIDVLADVTMSAVTLLVDGGTGSLKAQRVELRGFRLDLGGVHVMATQLACGPLELSWGDGFKLTAASVQSPHLDITLSGTVIRAGRVSADLLRVYDADISVTNLEVHSAEARMDLVAAPTDVGAEPADAGEMAEPLLQAAAQTAETDESSTQQQDGYIPELPVFDWRLLDHLSGQLNVDLGLNLQLARLRRRAVHALRIDIDQGTLDFRELEHDLSALEDALLDFSVRRRQLVLEVGLPLLPTRGFGKPIVRWELSEDDRKLAQARRVRLATLAKPKLSMSDDESSSADADAAPRGQSRPAALNELALRNIDVNLVVSRPVSDMRALLKSFEAQQIRVSGEVIHQADGLPQAMSQITASLRGVGLELDDFPVSGRRFDLSGFAIEKVPSCVVFFRGAKPHRFELKMHEVNAQRVDLGRFAEN